MPDARRRERRPRPPLDREKLDALALTYVARFATSRGRLVAYLDRKLRERGWDGPARPDPEAIADRCAQMGYIDDAAYALSRSRSLSERGYGPRRLDARLRADGIDPDAAAPARDLAASAAVDSAVRFAQRKRIGPFAAQVMDRKVADRALAQMLRAGHRFSVARAILALPPGTEIDDRERERLIDERGD